MRRSGGGGGCWIWLLCRGAGGTVACAPLRSLYAPGTVPPAARPRREAGDIRSRYVEYRGHRACWRAIVADGDAQGGAGVARVDPAAADGGDPRAGDGRAGGGGAGARSG